MAYADTALKAPVEVDEVGRRILLARDYLSDPKKWCNRGGGTGNSMCIHIALVEVGYAMDPSAARPAIERVADLIVGAPTGDVKDIHQFNDHPDTSHDDVLALLDKAAGVKP